MQKTNRTNGPIKRRTESSFSGTRLSDSAPQRKLSLEGSAPSEPGSHGGEPSRGSNVDRASEGDMVDSSMIAIARMKIALRWLLAAVAGMIVLPALPQE